MARNKSVIEISVIGHKELIEAQKAVTKYSDALKKAKGSVVDHKNATDAEAQSIAHAETNLKKARGEYRQAQRSIKELTKATQTSGSFTMKMAKAFGVAQLAVDGFKKVSQALANQITDSVKTFADFDIQMQKVKAISGANKEEFDKLKQSAQDLGRSTFFTATQVGELQMNFSKLGFSAAETLNAQSAALDMATATGEDLARTATVIGSSIRGFNLHATEATRVADVMAASFTSSALDLEKFQTSMTKVAPIAELMGVSLEATTAIMGKLSDAGIEASIAGTSLRNIFLKMGDPSSDLAKALGKTIGSGEELVAELKNLRDAGVDVEKMLAVVDQRQVAAFATMVKGVDVIESQILAFQNANGAAAEMAGTVGDSLKGAMFRFQSALDGLKIALVGGSGMGDALKQNIDRFAEYFNSIAENEEGLSNFANTIKRWIKILATGTAGIVAFKTATNAALITTKLITVATNAWGKATAFVKTQMLLLNTAIRTNPIGFIVGLLTTAASALLIFKDRTADAAAEQERMNQALREEQEILDRKIYEDFLKRNNLYKRIKDEQTGFITDVIASNDEVSAALKASVEEMGEDDLLKMAKFLKDRFAETSRQAEQADEGSILQKALVGDAKSWEKQYQLVKTQLERIQELRESLEGKGGTPVVTEPDGGLTPAQQELADAEMELRKQLLLDEQAFADGVIKTRDDLNDFLLTTKILHLKDMLKIDELEFEAKLSIMERLAKAEGQQRDKTVKSEKDKRDAMQENITAMKETGKLLMQIGELEGENSAVRRAGIKISQAAAIADGIHGLINAEVGIAEQAKLPFPANLIAMAATAAQVASVISSIKQLMGGGGGGSSQVETQGTFAKGGLTNGGMFEGASHANGGIKFAVGGRIMEAEGGEAIINKRSTAKFRPILSAINSYNGNGVKFADGGLINSGEKFAMGGELRSIQQMVSGGGSSKVVMVESDVTKTQGRVSSLEAQASF